MHTETPLPFLDEWRSVTDIQDLAFQKLGKFQRHEKYVLLLAIRVFELCSDCMMLLEKYRLSSPKIILRSAVETYIDLKCTIKDENHIAVLNNDFNWWMVGKSIEKNDELASEKHRAKIEDVRSLNIRQRFATAGENEIYDTLYKELSRHAHGNLERIVAEHSIEGQLSIGHPSERERIEFILSQVVLLAAVTLEECLLFLKVGEEFLGQISDIKKTLNNDA